MIADLFAGPGGWSEGLRMLGLTDIGYEFDRAACATRAAAGHTTVRADVRQVPLDPLTGRCEGLILSPPCQAFSSAGKGDGRAEASRLLAAIDRGDWSARGPGHEILEVGRWAEALRPAWVACEQVPPVLPLWQAYAARWRRLFGWSTWAGLLCAADYGVPQTRTRAFLLASADRTVEPPAPTHCKGGGATLFGDLAPWVSMAQALGWTGEMHHWRGAGMVERHGDRPGRSTDDPAFTIEGGAQRRMVVHRDPEQPAPTICGHRQPRWMYPDGNHEAVVLRAGAQDNATVRPVGEPAPTVLASWDNGDTQWMVRTGANSMVTGRTGSRAGDGDVQPYERPIDRPAPTVDSKVGQWQLNRRQQNPDGSPVPPVPPGQPAPTLTGIAGAKSQWIWERPATTVCGDPSLGSPGHRDPNEPGSQYGPDSVKLTLREALVLQSFRPDYPVQGNKSEQFTQVGNAVPPLLAAHVVSALRV